MIARIDTQIPADLMSTMQYRPVAAFAGPDRQIVHLSLVPLLPGVDALCGSPIYELKRSVPPASGPHDSLPPVLP